jgi:hypothetical protein
MPTDSPSPEAAVKQFLRDIEPHLVALVQALLGGQRAGHAAAEPTELGVLADIRSDLSEAAPVNPEPSVTGFPLPPLDPTPVSLSHQLDLTPSQRSRLPGELIALVERNEASDQHMARLYESVCASGLPETEKQQMLGALYLREVRTPEGPTDHRFSERLAVFRPAEEDPRVLAPAVVWQAPDGASQTVRPGRIRVSDPAQPGDPLAFMEAELGAVVEEMRAAGAAFVQFRSGRREVVTADVLGGQLRTEIDRFRAHREQGKKDLMARNFADFGRLVLTVAPAAEADLPWWDDRVKKFDSAFRRYWPVLQLQPETVYNGRHRSEFKHCEVVEVEVPPRAGERRQPEMVFKILAVPLRYATDPLPIRGVALCHK